jgi:hypothetical protein
VPWHLLTHAETWGGFESLGENIKRVLLTLTSLSSLMHPPHFTGSQQQLVLLPGWLCCQLLQQWQRLLV